MISKKIGGSDQISLIRCEKLRGCFFVVLCTAVPLKLKNVL